MVFIGTQLINCTKCDQTLARLDTSTLQVYNIKVDRDSKPFQRVNDKGEPIKKSDIKPISPLFNLNDRKTVIYKEDNKDTGITEETTTEEPMTITCICGHINNIN